MAHEQEFFGSFFKKELLPSSSIQSSQLARRHIEQLSLGKFVQLLLEQGRQLSRADRRDLVGERAREAEGEHGSVGEAGRVHARSVEAYVLGEGAQDVFDERDVIDLIGHRRRAASQRLASGGHPANAIAAGTSRATAH